MPTPSYVQILTGSCGRWLLTKLGRIVSLLGFFVVCLKTMVQYRSTGQKVMRTSFIQQIYFTGVQSLELICLIALLVGGLVVIQGISQLTRVGSREALAGLLTVGLMMGLWLRCLSGMPAARAGLLWYLGLLFGVVVGWRYGARVDLWWALAGAVLILFALRSAWAGRRRASASLGDVIRGS